MIHTLPLVPATRCSTMSLDIEAAAKWRKIRAFGGLMLVGGLVLSVLPMVISGTGAVVIYAFIVFGPFLLVVGIVTYTWALVGAWRSKRLG